MSAIILHGALRWIKVIFFCVCVGGRGGGGARETTFVISWCFTVHQSPTQKASNGKRIYSQRSKFSEFSEGSKPNLSCFPWKCIDWGEPMSGGCDKYQSLSHLVDLSPYSYFPYATRKQRADIKASFWKWLDLGYCYSYKLNRRKVVAHTDSDSIHAVWSGHTSAYIINGYWKKHW